MTVPKEVPIRHVMSLPEAPVPRRETDRDSGTRETMGDLDTSGHSSHPRPFALHPWQGELEGLTRRHPYFLLAVGAPQPWFRVHPSAGLGGLFIDTCEAWLVSRGLLVPATYVKSIAFRICFALVESN